MISNQADKIDEIKKKSIEIFKLLQKQFEVSLTALGIEENTTDIETGKGLKRLLELEEEAHQAAVDIERECCQILALNQPVAVQLRLLISIIKMNSYFKYISNLTLSLGEVALSIKNLHQLKPIFNFSLEPMIQAVKGMMNRTLVCFSNLNVDQAIAVIREDNIVDNFNKEMKSCIEESLLKYKQKENNKEIDSSLILMHLHYLGVAKLLERVADRMVSIAEAVIYIVEGTVVKHKTETL